ncbi:MAG: metal ABC transporter ATP-binding protein [Candidatus Liptonbacteria bacterium]|nr:metal ABC transporter ATP-binding protein [Candidatus Liptonbacteria bacterium]
MSRPSPLLTVSGLTVAFDGMPVVENVSFRIVPNEVVAIIGPNGSGKSTLLRALIGVVKPAGGTIAWKKGVRIGYLPQRLFIEKGVPLTVREFLSLKSGITPAMTAEALSAVGVSGSTVANQRLGDLSGGTFQRVLVAWAIADKPDILLLDEPTESVDVKGQQSIFHLMHQLRDQAKMAVVIVSHDLTMVYHHADTVLCMNREMVCHGAPEAVLTQEQLVKLFGEHATPYLHRHI